MLLLLKILLLLWSFCFYFFLLLFIDFLLFVIFDFLLLLFFAFLRFVQSRVFSSAGCFLTFAFNRSSPVCADFPDVLALWTCTDRFPAAMLLSFADRFLRPPTVVPGWWAAPARKKVITGVLIFYDAFLIVLSVAFTNYCPYLFYCAVWLFLISYEAKIYFNACREKLIFPIN